MAILVPYENLVIACFCNTSQKKETAFVQSLGRCGYMSYRRAVEGYLTITTGRVSLMPLLAGGVVVRER